MTKSTVAALGYVKFVGQYPFSLLVARNNHLCNAFAVVDDERLAAKVDEDDANKTTVVGIYGAGSVEHGDAMLQSKAAAWTYLCLDSGWQCYAQTCWDQYALHGLQCDGLVEVCSEIDTGRLLGGVCWKWVM